MRWQEYQTLSDMEKKASLSANSVLRTFNPVEKQSVFMDKNIVEVLLDDVMSAAM